MRGFSLRTIRERKDAGLEEERRLMYVAVTRAEQLLFLTESEGFNFQTKTDKFPSRFLVEIKDSLLRIQGEFKQELFNQAKTLIEAINYGAIDNTHHASYTVGEQVFHKVFGCGVIIAVNEDGSNDYTVSFGDKSRHIPAQFLSKRPTSKERPRKETINVINSITEEVDNISMQSETKTEVEEIIEEDDSPISVKATTPKDKITETLEKKESDKFIKPAQNKKKRAIKIGHLLLAFFIVFSILVGLSVYWTVSTNSMTSYIALGFFAWLSLCAIIAILI